MASSSISTAASIMAARYSAALSTRSAGISSSWNLAPLSSPSQTIAFIVRRSMTPLKLASAPIGSLQRHGAGRRASP